MSVRHRAASAALMVVLAAGAGFGGAALAAVVFHDELQGEQGPAGRPGEIGPSGPAGPAGPQGEAGTGLERLAGAYVVAGAFGCPVGTSSLMPRSVVTEVRYIPSGNEFVPPILDTDDARLCLIAIR